MSDSDAPCQYCGEGAWGSSYVSDGKQEFRLCSDCRKQWELKLGYSHKFIAERCPTCKQLKGLGIVKYTENDGKHQCSVCGGWVDWLTKGKCDDCDNKRASEPELQEQCPECKSSDIIIAHGRMISGWETQTKECGNCGWSITRKLHKLAIVEPPEGVKPIFEVNP